MLLHRIIAILIKRKNKLFFQNFFLVYTLHFTVFITISKKVVLISLHNDILLTAEVLFLKRLFRIYCSELSNL